jgi:hypothetical protein
LIPGLNHEIKVNKTIKMQHNAILFLYFFPLQYKYNLHVKHPIKKLGKIIAKFIFNMGIFVIFMFSIIAPKIIGTINNSILFSFFFANQTIRKNRKYTAISNDNVHSTPFRMGPPVSMT